MLNYPTILNQLQHSLLVRILITTTIVGIGILGCSPSPSEDTNSSNDSESLETTATSSPQLIIGSDTAIPGFTHAVLESTKEDVYLSPHLSDRVSEFDSLAPSLTKTGLHVSLWIPQSSLEKLSNMTKNNVGNRLIFQAFGKVFTLAKINQAIQFQGPAVSVGIALPDSSAKELLAKLESEN